MVKRELCSWPVGLFLTHSSSPQDSPGPGTAMLQEGQHKLSPESQFQPHPKGYSMFSSEDF